MPGNDNHGYTYARVYQRWNFFTDACFRQLRLKYYTDARIRKGGHFEAMMHGYVEASTTVNAHFIYGCAGCSYTVVLLPLVFLNL